MKTYKAKAVDIPARVIKQLDSMTLAVGPQKHTLSDIIADMGEIRNRNSWIMAVGLMRTYQGLVDAHKDVSGEKFSITAFSEIITGLMISYTLGLGEWDDELPVFMPSMIDYEKLSSYDRVKLRNGKKIEVHELIRKISNMASPEALKEVFTLVYGKKNWLGNYKQVSPAEKVKVLLSMIDVADQKL